MQGGGSARVQGETPGMRVVHHLVSRPGAAGGGTRNEHSREEGDVEGGREVEARIARTSGVGGIEGGVYSQKSGGRGAAMNYSGSRIPNGKVPGGGPLRVPERRTGNGTRLGAFLGDSRGHVTCGACRVTLQLG